MGHETARFPYQALAALLDEAFGLLATDPGAKLIAGGQSLMPILALPTGCTETEISHGGQRWRAHYLAGEFIIGPVTTLLYADEIFTELHLPL